MLGKFPHKNTQFHRARLISPYFDFLRNNEFFLKDIEDFRAIYDLSDRKTGDHEIPLQLLYEEYWDPDFDSMKIVLSYGDELRGVWEEFHTRIESIAEKYKLKNFPNLIKEFILTGRFGDLLFTYSMTCKDEGCIINVPRSIKKMDFMKIWDQIQKYNEGYGINESIYNNYSDEILEKYSFIEKIYKKFLADQKDIILLINKELSESSSQDIEGKISGWDKSKKSRLNKIVSKLFSLLDDLNDAEI